MTTASLEMEVDSRQVAQAKPPTDALTRSAEKLDDANDKLAAGADKAGKKTKQFGDKAEKSSKKVGRLEKASTALTGRVKLLAAGVVAAGTAFGVAFGGRTLRDFSKFEAGFSKVETLFDDTSFAAGGLEENVSKLRSGLQDLRSQSGDSFDNLNKGLFDLVSAGVAADDSLRVLTDANTLARAGATDVSIAVDGLTTSINAYGESAGRSEVLASKFFTTQKFGKTTVEDLAKGLGQVAPLAAELGVSFDELLASQAAATATGIRQSEAYTGLKAALTNIVKPAEDAKNEAARLGVEFNSAALKAKGLTEFLLEIKDSSEFADDSFQKLFGSIEGLNFIMAVTGGGAEIYAKTLSELSDETKSVATLQDAYSKVLNDTDERMKRFKGTLGAVSIAVGAGLAPAFGDLTEKVTNFFKGDDFQARLQGITDGVAGAVATLGNNWDSVETGVTAAATALTVYLALNLAGSLATTLRLASAWVSVGKAVRAAAASVALLGAASGATGLKALIAGTGAFSAQLGRAVLSVGALRAAWIGLSQIVSKTPIGLVIVGAITALVTFRKEISDTITGTRDLGTAFRAFGNVAADRIDNVRDKIGTLATAIQNGFENITGISVIKDIASAVNDRLVPGLQSLSRWAGNVRQALAEMIPQEVMDAAKFLADRIDNLNKAFGRFTGVGLARDFINDVRTEVDDIERRASVVNSANEFRAQNDNAPIGIFLDPSIDAARQAFSKLNTEAGAYLRVAQKAGDASNALAENQTGLAGSVGATEKGLRDQLAVAERLAAAAEGGKISFDIEVNAIGLEAAAQAAVEEAKKAGEDLSLATAKILVGRIDDLENAAQAMLNAEKALRDRAANRAGNIASDLDGRIGAFNANVQNADLRSVGPNAGPLIRALEGQFQALVRDIDELSIGLNTGQLETVYKALEDAGVNLGNLTLEAIREGGLGLSARIKQALADGVPKILVATDLATSFADVGAQFFGELTSAVNTFKRGADRSFEAISSLASRVATSLEGGLKDLGSLIGGGLGGTLGKIGGIAGTVGAVAGLFANAVDFFKSIFSKASNNTAQAVFRPSDGFVAGRGQDGSASDPNAKARDAILESILDVTKPIADLIGAFSANPSNTPQNDSFLNLAVRQDRRTREQFIELGFQGPNGEPFQAQRFDASGSGALEAVEEGIRLAILAFRGGESALLDFAQSAAKAGRPIEEIVQVLDVLNGALSSGKDSLAKYANAAARAGLSADTIVEGINSINAVYALTAEPLSNIAEAIKSIDDAVGPAISALKAARQGFSDIENVRDDALRTLGVSFVDGIKELNLRLKNETLANYKGVLDEIEERQNDAFALFERGAITQGEFDVVQATGGLQAAQFFKGLDDEARKNLTAYLGVLGDVSGDIAVARARLEEQFDFLIDNVEDTASKYEDAARNFESLGQGIRQTAEGLRVQFSGLSPRANVDELLGRVSTLRAEGLEGNASALQAIPQVVTSLLESARQAFGGTEQFARVRDIGLAALDDTATSSERLAKENFEAADSARTDLELLADIRNLIDDERQLTTLQGILDTGQLTNKLMEAQLQSFLGLFGQDGQAANAVSIEQLQAAAAQAILDQQRATNDNSVVSSSIGASTTTSTTSATTASADQTTDLATAIDRQTTAVAEMTSAVNDLAAELRQEFIRTGTQ